MTVPRQLWAASIGLALFFLTLFSVHLGMSAAVQAAPSAAMLAQRPDDGRCGGAVTATLSANPVSVCDAVTVTARVEPTCPMCPDGVNIVFVHIDAPQNGWQYRESVLALEEAARMTVSPSKVNAAVVLYNSTEATTVLRMTDDMVRVRAALNRASSALQAVSVPDEAALLAVQELRRSRGPRQVPCEFVIFFTYASFDRQIMRERIEQASRTILAEGVTLMVGCPISSGTSYCRGPEPEMPQSRRWFTKYNESGALQSMVRDEMRTYQRGSKVRQLTLTQDIPAGLTYIEGSATGSPALTQLTDGSRLTWTWDDADAGNPYTVTYQLDPTALGSHTIKGEMTVIDNTRGKQTKPVPDLDLEVVDLCPTLSPTPTVARTIETPRPTSTITPTPTPSIFKIYLPLLP